MAFDGNGNFVLTYNWPNDKANGIPITASRMQGQEADMATNGLSLCMTRNGQSPATANIPLGGFKLTGIGAATTTGDALSFGRAATITTLVLTGQETVGDGTVGAPSYSFSGDPDTGFYRIGNSTIGYSGNGVQIFTANGNGIGFGKQAATLRVIDGLTNSNGPLYAWLQNDSVLGTLAETKFGAFNDTYGVDFGITGAGFTPQGVFTGNTSFIHSNAPNHVFATNAGGNIYFSTSGPAGRYDGALVSTGQWVFGSPTPISSSHAFYANGAYNTLVVRNAAANGFGLEIDLAGTSGSGNYLTCAQDFAGTPTIKMQVLQNGNIQNSNNSYGAISMAERKENISLANSQWNDVKALSRLVCNFNLKGDSRRQIGMVIGGEYDAAEICPNLVEGSGEEKAWLYSVMQVKAFKALGEAMARIEILEAKWT